MGLSEQILTVQRQGFALKGKLCLPGGGDRMPLVLILQGSGPVDRDGNLGGAGGSLYAKLAQALAGYGVASFRYDKRGVGASGGDFLATGYQDLVDDGQACWEHLANTPFCDHERIYLMGHSEGTAIAAQLSARLNPAPRALIQLCPFGQGAHTMLIQQYLQLEREVAQAPGLDGVLLRGLNRLFGPFSQRLQKQLAHVRTLDGGTARMGLTRVSARWLRELIELEIAPLYRAVPCPMLLLAGEKDLQCPPDSVEALLPLLQQPAQYRLIPNMVHHLVACEGQARLLGGPSTDALPLAPQLLACLQGWFAREAGVSACNS
ncbi:alpha-beta hydrolase superfamily lysophospholipase [Paucibacter oligotrophus]|uniref:Alpha-beta hydrolase superfamily lysophospholipase n=1 Tax=Roseateles oligotrophus TaxID=1769250 RepID=A0A840L0P5_9BURK|nr:alpha/beta fold hydrolase [Roseateles oligotrophus]MBB4842004.1 alpha-beta hydrolase superfamily lysophospholipase [Roseateles oligotrophus]